MTQFAKAFAAVTKWLSSPETADDQPQLIVTGSLHDKRSDTRTRFHARYFENFIASGYLVEQITETPNPQNDFWSRLDPDVPVQNHETISEKATLAEALEILRRNETTLTQRANFWPGTMTFTPAVSGEFATSLHDAANGNTGGSLPARLRYRGF